MHLLWVKIDPFGCDNESNEFSIGNPQEEFFGIHLQLLCSHEVKNLIQIG